MTACFLFLGCKGWILLSFANLYQLSLHWILSSPAFFMIEILETCLSTILVILPVHFFLCTYKNTQVFPTVNNKLTTTKYSQTYVLLGVLHYIDLFIHIFHKMTSRFRLFLFKHYLPRFFSLLIFFYWIALNDVINNCWISWKLYTSYYSWCSLYLLLLM